MKEKRPIPFLHSRPGAFTPRKRSRNSRCAGTRWLTDYFFNAHIAHECKGKAKGARLHSFGACREAFYVAEEKARLREGAAKLRADEDREDSSTGSEDAS